MKRAAPPIWPYLDHRPLTNHGYWNFKAGEQTIRKGWWPSTIAGYDIAGRKL